MMVPFLYELSCKVYSRSCGLFDTFDIYIEGGEAGYLFNYQMLIFCVRQLFPIFS